MKWCGASSIILTKWVLTGTQPLLAARAGQPGGGARAVRLRLAYGAVVFRGGHPGTRAVELLAREGGVVQPLLSLAVRGTVVLACD